MPVESQNVIILILAQLITDFKRVENRISFCDTGKFREMQ